MRSSGFLILPALLIGAMICSSGCGRYTMKSPHRAGIRTVAVPIWTRGKNVYRRDIEMDLTEAIQKRIQLDTPYAIASEAQADTKLVGRIEEIDQTVLSEFRTTGRPVEIEVTFILSYTWTDLRTGKVLVRKSNYQVRDTYITAPAFREEFFYGEQAVINRAARRIVETMEAEW